MVKAKGENEVLRCSFCNKDQNDVRKLIAGPTVFICDECVEVCNDIIADDNRFENRGTRSSLPTPLADECDSQWKCVAGVATLPAASLLSLRLLAVRHNPPSLSMRESVDENLLSCSLRAGLECNSGL